MTLLRILFVITSCVSFIFGQGVNPLSITRLSPTQFRLSWYANALRPYQIENSPDLINWTELTGYIEGTNTQQNALVNKTAEKMFFRLKTGAMRSGFNSKSLVAIDDENHSGLEPIGFPINVFPTVADPGPWTECYVNDNGNLSIGTPVVEFTPLPLQTSAQEIYGLIALIAPFWGDVDTSPAEDPQRANGCKVVTYGQGYADGRKAFGVNWASVGYYSRRTEKLNSFQLVLIDRSNIGVTGDLDVEFNYNQILWETGSYYTSGGSNGYGGYPARVGITNGVSRTIEAQYSGETLAQLDFNTSTGSPNHASGLIYRKRNSAVPGRLVFQFRGGTLLDALQVYAGIDQPLSSGITAATLIGTASDPAGGSVTVEWSVLSTNGSTVPVVIANPTQLSTGVTFGAGARIDFQLVARRPSDLTISASDVTTINP